MKMIRSFTRTASPKILAEPYREQPVWGVWVFVLLFSLTLSSGCAHFSAAKKTVWQLNPFAAKGEGGQPTLTAYALQQELMRFADDYSSMTGEIADELAAKASTSMDRVRPLAMKVSQADAAISIASSPNPLAGVMDMTVLVTLTRSSFENYLAPEVYGGDPKGAVEKYRRAESQVWELAAQVLDAKHLDELKHSINQWWEDNPEQRDVSFVRLQNLSKSKAARIDHSKPYGSIFSLLFIDPFAGLDPAAREMEMSRHTAERAMYRFQRMPRMLDWQLSLALSKALAIPEVQNLLADVDRFSMATEQIPKQIAEERAAIIKDLDANEPRLRALLADFRMTLEAGGVAANSVNETVLTLNRFVASREKASTQGITNSPSSRPFDVTEYGTSAVHIANAAREVDTLVNSIDQSELVDHMFWRAVSFVLMSLAGVVAAMLLYRAIAVRFLKVK